MRPETSAEFLASWSREAGFELAGGDPGRWSFYATRTCGDRLDYLTVLAPKGETSRPVAPGRWRPVGEPMRDGRKGWMKISC